MIPVTIESSGLNIAGHGADDVPGREHSVTAAAEPSGGEHPPPPPVAATGRGMVIAGGAAGRSMR